MKAIKRKVKVIAKKISLLVAVNKIIKARKIKYELKRLHAYYLHQALELGISYDENHAWSVAKSRMKDIWGKMPVLDKKIRIFWVGANRDQDESGFLQALRKIATVTEFHNWTGSYGQWYWDESGQVQVFDRNIVDLNDKELVNQVKLAKEKDGIDILMGQMWANYISKEALARIRSYGIPVINISMDDRLPDNWSTKMGTRLGAVGLASVTDLVLTTSSETCAWYGVEGCPAIFWPLASDPHMYHGPTVSDRDINVLFIGNKYGIRGKIVAELEKCGIQISCYGEGWPNGYSNAEKSAMLFKRAKIILGIGTIGYCSDVYTIKLRDFDALMSGAMYLTHRNPDLTKIFVEGKHFECYENVDECVKKIKFYLDNEYRRMEVANAGYLYASTNYSWDIHLKRTFSSIGLNQFD